MSPTVGGATQRSNPIASIAHHRSGTSNCTRDTSRNKRPKGGNCPQRSWKIKIPFFGVKKAELQECSNILKPHRESRVTGIGVIAPRSEEAHRHLTGADEGLVTSRKYEEVSRAAYLPKTDPCHPNKSDGSLSTTSTSARKGMPTI
jgi:hypothetical protein